LYISGFLVQKLLCEVLLRQSFIKIMGSNHIFQSIIYVLQLA